MPNFRVEQVLGQETWASQYGPMVSWTLRLTNLDTNQAVPIVSINSKPERPYNVGDTFYADIVGERAGVPKLKRSRPLPGVAQNGPGSPARTVSPSNDPVPVPYEKALAAYRRFAKDMDTPEHATSLFIAWCRGDIGDPPAEQEDLRSEEITLYRVEDPFEGQLIEPERITVERITPETQAAVLALVKRIEAKNKGAAMKVYRDVCQERPYNQITEQEGKKLVAKLEQIP